MSTKRPFNWKARQKVNTTVVEDSQCKKIAINLQGFENDKFDKDNVLVLPSKKRKTNVKADKKEQSAPKKLSKKHRKRLQHIIDTKDKKMKRAELFNSLQKVQISAKELAMLNSTTDLYRGKFYSLEDKQKKSVDETIKVNAIAGSKRKGAILENSASSSSESSSDESETESEEEEEMEETDKQEEAADTVPDIVKGVDDKIKSKISKTQTHSERVVNIPVNRTEEIQEQRLKLPILAEEQLVMETINDNDVTILCGETGSGKTTQVPQFLYEAGYAHSGGIIAVTQPRRVAAISMSHRVAHEMNLSHKEVSYLIRYEGNVTEGTRIKFMTDGVLLKEVQNDFLLTKYSVIIIDEAHERSVYTDILIGLLSRIVPIRNKRKKPLKLIIMSATLRVEDFTENARLFKITPPVVKVESRQFPVTVHFNKRTPLTDYVTEAYKKVCKIHRKLPPGGILVFVTGQQEVHAICAKLRRSFPMLYVTTKDANKKPKSRKRREIEDDESGTDSDGSTSETTKEQQAVETEKKSSLPVIDLDDYSVMPEDEEAELHVPDGDQSDDELSADGMSVDDSEEEEVDDDVGGCTEPIYPLPLYSLLSTDKQNKVFQDPPPGCRLCVVATNVAETSITIPNIKYVVDTGRTKTKYYDKVTGVSTFRVTWTSKASANQRAGRAGRTSAGHCYRLYSSAVFNDDFDQFSPPEITRRPVEDLILQMKSMCIDRVANFPFPTPPSDEAVTAAENLLISLGAVTKPVAKRFKDIHKLHGTGVITPLGKIMVSFPVAPRYAKMLSAANQHGLLPYAVALVSALSVQEVFVEHAHSESEADVRQRKSSETQRLQHTWAGAANSRALGDMVVLLKAVGACEYAGSTQDFCEKHSIRYKAITEIRKLRAQLTNTVNSVIPEASLVIDPQLTPPTDLQCKLLRQILLMGLGDHVARKIAAPPLGTEDRKKLKMAYQCTTTDDPVFIHPSSVLYKCDREYVIYQHIQETSKLYMKGITAIEPEWLPEFAAAHCVFSKPLETPEPSYDFISGSIVCQRSAVYGPHSWALEASTVPYPPGLDCYKYFARYLLEGTVCAVLQPYTASLLSLPVTMNKSWAKLQPRTETLLKALVAEKVCSTKALKAAWIRNKNYLLIEYCEWIPETLHAEVSTKWPPMQV